MSKNTERLVWFYFSYEKCRFPPNTPSLFTQSWFSAYSDVRFLGLDVSPVQSSWHFFWGFLYMGMATEPKQFAICNSIHAFWQACSLFHPWILQRFGRTRPSSRLDRDHPLLLLHFDLRLCPLLQKIIPELKSTMPFYLYQ